MPLLKDLRHRSYASSGKSVRFSCVLNSNDCLKDQNEELQIPQEGYTDVMRINNGWTLVILNS